MLFSYATVDPSAPIRSIYRSENMAKKDNLIKQVQNRATY